MQATDGRHFVSENQQRNKRRRNERGGLLYTHKTNYRQHVAYLAEVISSMSEDSETRNTASASSLALALSLSPSSDTSSPSPCPEALSLLVAAAASSGGGIGRLVVYA